MKQGRRFAWFVLATVLLCALLGGAYGQRVRANVDANSDSDVQQSLKTFTEVYQITQDNYATPLNPDTALYGPTGSSLGAIPGMLRTLDPHSIFFDPHAYAQLREDQEGRYFGVGMQIGPRPGKLGRTVTEVILPTPGSPAFRAGLRPGDIIVYVDGKSTEGLDTGQVAAMLKGPRGTPVRISVTREGSPQPLEFTLVRAEISRESVDEAFFIRPGIAYIHIRSFSETTNDELTADLDKLGLKNIRGMVLDLRGNPGGLLQEAVDVSDHFLAKNQLIVYHSGRNSTLQRYYAMRGDNQNEYPIVVLINRYTASAAEIVTGALQDHDRALVMGEPSFGKGLVQTVYPLSDHTGLALTTAHYYTPSGRLIQRDYSDVSIYDYYFHYNQGTQQQGDIHHTDGGREVFGGGGITPDVKASEPKPTLFQDSLLIRAVFFNFGKYYLASHETVPLDFQPDDSTIEDFKKFLASQQIQIPDYQIEDNLDFIKERIREQLVQVLYGEDAAGRIRAQNDSEVQKALENLGQARVLMTDVREFEASQSSSAPR